MSVRTYEMTWASSLLFIRAMAEQGNVELYTVPSADEMSCAEWRAHASRHGFSAELRDEGARVFHARKAHEVRSLLRVHGRELADMLGVPQRAVDAWAHEGVKLAPDGPVRKKIASLYRLLA